MSLKFVEHNPFEDSSRAKRINDNEWNTIKPIIKYLYLDQGLTLSQVKTQLQTQHNAVASERQLKRLMAKWGFSKYIAHDKMAARMDNVVSGSSSPIARDPHRSHNLRSPALSSDRGPRSSRSMSFQQLNTRRIEGLCTKKFLPEDSTYGSEEHQTPKNRSGDRNLLACPFFIYDALAFSCCAVCSFQDFDTLKDHILEDFIFYSLSIAQGDEEPPWTIVTSRSGILQREAISAIASFMKTLRSRDGMAQNWMTMYKRLFPFNPLPESPFIEDHLHRQAIQQQVNLFHILGDQGAHQLVQAVSASVRKRGSCERSSLEVFDSAYRLFARQNKAKQDNQFQHPNHDSWSSVCNTSISSGDLGQPYSMHVAPAICYSPMSPWNGIGDVTFEDWTSDTVPFTISEPIESYGDDFRSSSVFPLPGFDANWSDDQKTGSSEEFNMLEEPLLGLNSRLEIDDFKIVAIS